LSSLATTCADLSVILEHREDFRGSIPLRRRSLAVERLLHRSQPDDASIANRLARATYMLAQAFHYADDLPLRDHYLGAFTQRMRAMQARGISVDPELAERLDVDD